MNPLETLIARLEAATEGSDALDREIATACGVEWRADEDGNYGGYNILPRSCRFTRSIDAALTLVPEGWVWTCGNYNEDDTAWACITSPLNIDDGSGCVDYRGDAAAPALALCIACLKARIA